MGKDTAHSNRKDTARTDRRRALTVVLALGVVAAVSAASLYARGRDEASEAPGTPVVGVLSLPVKQVTRLGDLPPGPAEHVEVA